MGQTIPLEPKKKDVTTARYTVFCCQGSDCVKNGAKSTMKALRSAIRNAGLKGQVAVIKTECADKCKDGPVMIACSACGHGPCGAVWYREVDEDDAELIVQQHLVAGTPVKSKQFPLKTK